LRIADAAARAERGPLFGSAAARMMGVALMPGSVPDAYRATERACARRKIARGTSAAHREEAPQAKVAAFADIRIPKREQTRKEAASRRP
jgi:hypothetical protein